uniref:ENT domain-containing protein n=1 Tax=Echinostoma caproni TaxID=27848 RepID=A0A183B9Z1_9TREM
LNLYSAIFGGFFLLSDILSQETPVTVVAKTRSQVSRPPNAANVSKDTASKPITVVRRGTKRSTISTDTSLETVSRTVWRRRGTVKQTPTTIALNSLDASTVTPAPARKASQLKRPLANTTFLSQDEPIAARLRVRSTQMSYLESNMTRLLETDYS